MRINAHSRLAWLVLLIALLIPVASRAADRKLEVFSWWTSGSEAAALDKLFQIFRKANPGVEIINASVAGGGGSAARPVLQARLSGGSPPDSWQSHPGLELLGQYVAANYCEPITDLYQSEGWDKVVPKYLLDLVTKDGKNFAVLAGVHRGNVLWYNKKILAKNGIKIGSNLTIEDFLADSAKLKAAGVTPLAVGDSGIWASAELFENTLLGIIGPQAWNDLVAGKMAWDDPKIRLAAETYGKFLSYQNADHGALSWDQAVKQVAEGNCAFTSMADWAYGEFAKARFKENEDFGWVSHPGSEGSFIVVADGFTLAKNAAHKEDCLAWLKAVGSKEAQETFNSLKGSIPARSDVDKTHFGQYQSWSMDSFSKDTLLPSLVHGEAVPAAFEQALNEAVTYFVADRKVDSFVNALVQAAKDTDIGR
jgi:glucose/mannose transport system substrate-binding protein